ncbi:MFS general substrate transporter [Patellaria atrata CBS 101060]|uniref:MFS general substrate transporter n=1 Tax=Patellaria atrata CBS 101060 TaxID=1346257 RepID=A0A9P4S4Z6_9PEZI|nr:MFS general substrate transporter [Patellaria atrata CBS 101060]
MLGFHRRTRSLIPVKDLGKYDKVPIVVDEDEVEDIEDLEMAIEAPKKSQLTLIYIIFLAEAIMASSLQPQLRMLISNDDYCGNLSTSYLRSILDCAYAFGGTAGILWGRLSDRIGRRPVALVGLFGMFVCCLLMGFETGIISCTIARFFAGLVSSSVVVTVLTMIGDVSQTPADRAINVAKLPLIAVCGSVGPLAQGMVSGSLRDYGAIWEKYPTLSSQIACGSLVLIIAVVSFVILDETLPSLSQPSRTDSPSMDYEKAAFLGQEYSEDDDALTIRVFDYSYSRPEPITINQFLQAPSLLVLLGSFSLLSLQASIFDVLLPHIGHGSTQHGGMGIPCSWLGLIVLLVRAIAGLAILKTIPYAITKLGLLKPYRSLSIIFPALYIITPVLVFLFGCSEMLTAFVSTISIFVKHALTGSASVIVGLLMLNATPDAYSAGTVVGLMQIANLFKALAVAVSGASFYLSNDYSVAATNYALWTGLVLFGGVGAALAWFVRERPSVERDFPSEVLCWETCFDAERAAELK